MTTIFTYTVFLPMILLHFSSSHALGTKGIALVDWTHMGDIDSLSSHWYYGWGEYCSGKDSRCINMVREMQLPKSCYSMLLVGNEPNWEEPSGHPVTPTVAAMDVMAIEKMCPNTKLIVGNVAGYVPAPNLLGADWLSQFLSEYKRLSGHGFHQALSVHCYANWSLPDFCQNGGYGYASPLKTMRSIYGGEMWVTEANCLYCAQNDFSQMVDFISINFDRYSFYTNRQPAQGYIDGWALDGADLVNADGTLTPNGSVYRSFP